MKVRSSSCYASKTLSSGLPWHERLSQRWAASWWMERVEVRDLNPRTNPLFRGGLLAASRHERVRPAVAMLGLSAFLCSQCILPGALLLSEVHADEARRTQVVKAKEKVEEANTPLWAKMLRARIKKDKATRAAVLSNAALAASPVQGSGFMGFSADSPPDSYLRLAQMESPDPRERHGLFPSKRPGAPGVDAQGTGAQAPASRPALIPVPGPVRSHRPRHWSAKTAKWMCALSI